MAQKRPSGADIRSFFGGKQAKVKVTDNRKNSEHREVSEIVVEDDTEIATSASNKDESSGADSSISQTSVSIGQPPRKFLLK